MKMINVMVFVGTLSAVAPLWSAPEKTHPGYTATLAAINHAIDNTQAIAELHPMSWVHQEPLARALLERARLTGDIDDMTRVQAALDRAFSLAEEGAGPFWVQSQLSYSSHKLEQARANLAAINPIIALGSTTSKQQRALLSADIALHQGDYARAKYGYEHLEHTQPSVDTAIRLALYHGQTGQYDIADQWFEQAFSRVQGLQPRLRSWLYLQLGILDLTRGKLSDALTHYEAGNTLFPGYWLIEEHIAEIDALQGRTMIAESRYRDLVERTDNPLFMVALAELLSERDSNDDQLEARSWHAMAEQTFLAQMSVSPESAGGHALDYFLTYGNPQKTLDLARRHFALRPDGPASTQLARAYLLAGDMQLAEVIVSRVLGTAFRSPDLHAVAHEIYHGQGKFTQAQWHSKQALMLNPGLQGAL